MDRQLGLSAGDAAVSNVVASHRSTKIYVYFLSAGGHLHLCLWKLLSGWSQQVLTLSRRQAYLAGPRSRLESDGGPTRLRYNNQEGRVVHLEKKALWGWKFGLQ